ncbi:MAG TPA: hypothetical protein VF047_06345 [Nitrososphaeraceae archaeon]
MITIIFLMIILIMDIITTNLFFSYSNFTSQNKENSEFNVDVEIKIQKGLKIIENYLKNYPKTYVAKRISELRSRYIRAQSDKPMKKYLVNGRRGDL